MLKNETVHKYLISTPAKFVGDYETQGISINLSFPIDKAMLHIQDSAYSRTFIVVTLNIPSEEPSGIVFGPNQSIYGEIFCVLLSILYGKEFKFHGLLETYGIHRLPNMNNEPNAKYTLPFYNSSPRIDLEIPLNLENFRLIESIILDDQTAVSDDFRKKFLAAGKFYNRAIRIFPNEPELAYLDLITCGEIISSFYEESLTDNELYDEQLLEYFKVIETMDNGQSIVRNIKRRLYQVKRKFTASALKNLNDEFFSKNETIGNIGKITKDNAETIVKAGYDLRSLYVHEGLEFGDYITPDKNYHNERVLFSPYGLGTKETKVIGNSPTFLGLERMIRFSLLTLLNSNGVPLDERLNK